MPGSAQPRQAERRRFPRAVSAVAGEIEVVYGQASNRLIGLTLSVSVTSVAPTGMRVKLCASAAEELAPGSRINVRFGTGEFQLELPGEVMWLSGGAVVLAGIALRLEVARARDRQRYAAWIVEQLSLSA